MKEVEKVNPEMVMIGRESRGLTHLELADKLKVSKATAWRLENDVYGINQDIIASLSKELHYPESCKLPYNLAS